MSRHMQNMVMGGLGFLVAVVTMIAATIYLTQPDGAETAAVQPLDGELSSIDASGADPGAPSPEVLANRPASTLDVSAAFPTSTILSITTTTTTATTTTTTTATTAAPSSTTAAPTTAATVSSTTVSSTTESPTTEPPTTVSSTTESSTTESSTTSDPESDPGQLNEIEREILRLTNELRTNPNGPLAREGDVINCDGKVRIDESGKYEPIGALEGSLVASLEVARPWSAYMTIDNFKHQPDAGVSALQSAGIEVRAVGENIAYTSYADKAERFFTGWRESDGHFCNMMNPNYTHLGVGEVTKTDQGFEVSFATQTFFSTR